jgi:DeoR/GlpR family transcriptional regulator of sugar metabolism
MRIRRLLADSPVLASTEIARILGISVVTVRRDLKRLEHRGEINRTRGGAIAVSHGTAWEALWDAKYGVNEAAKLSIGRAAAALVRPGDTVLLDSGSTVARVAQEISVPCKIVTIDLKTGLMLASRVPPLWEVTVAGGRVRPGLYGLVGSWTVDFLAEVHVDWTFLGADGVDIAAGITNATFDEVPVKRALIDAGKTVVLVADASKIGKVALATVTRLDRAHRLIVDDAIEPEVLAAIRDLGLDVTVVH